ncbi:hypothetical protein PsYK624_161660 [Phanerochaete sordida]|uniref:Uncharacterized protein n=1 Tax=Phanerochaete sordida TaxID=48140 RepID=A0A9P3GRL8_9APHY|nr:hypothetical protein PsYK624_161660 [Phanerochaete sordida]
MRSNIPEYRRECTFPSTPKPSTSVCCGTNSTISTLLPATYTALHAYSDNAATASESPRLPSWISSLPSDKAHIIGTRRPVESEPITTATDHWQRVQQY